MNLRKIEIILVILCLFAVEGCGTLLDLSLKRNRIVPYAMLGAYMEYTIEDDTAVIRTSNYADSIRSITDFKIEEGEDSGMHYKRYLLTLLFNRTLDDHKRNPNLKRTKWNGFKININNISTKARFFYKDETGTYLIHKGSIESWRNFLEEMLSFRKDIVAQEEIDKMMEDY